MIKFIIYNIIRNDKNISSLMYKNDLIHQNTGGECQIYLVNVMNTS